MYRLNNNLVHSRVLQTDDLGVEEYFGRSEAFRSDLHCQLVLDMLHRLDLTFIFWPSGSV